MLAFTLVFGWLFAVGFGVATLATIRSINVAMAMRAATAIERESVAFAQIHARGLATVALVRSQRLAAKVGA